MVWRCAMKVLKFPRRSGRSEAFIYEGRGPLIPNLGGLNGTMPGIYWRWLGEMGHALGTQREGSLEACPRVYTLGL